MSRRSRKDEEDFEFYPYPLPEPLNFPFAEPWIFISHLVVLLNSPRAPRGLIWAADRIVQHGKLGERDSWPDYVRKEVRKSTLYCRFDWNAGGQLFFRPEFQSPDTGEYNYQGWAWICLGFVQEMGVPFRRCKNQGCRTFFAAYGRDKGKLTCCRRCSNVVRSHTFYEKLKKNPRRHLAHKKRMRDLMRERRKVRK